MIDDKSSADIDDSKVKDGNYIVGVGASAGGLEAIHDLFDNVPKENIGIAFVIIQHLSPDYKSLMAELLTKHTSMKVMEAEEGMEVESDCVYVIPNKKNIILKENKLGLVDKSGSHPAPNTAIDIFFKSLAEEKGKNAIGVILSGTGTDGTKGIEAIKAKGGYAIVQDPLTAKFDGMPNSAISAGNIDAVLPPEMIPEEILSHINKEPVESGALSPQEEDYLKEILEFIRLQTNLDFTSYKRPTITRRINRRMLMNNISDIGEYLEFIYENPSEVNVLCKEFLIGVTKFFRDTEAFDFLKAEVIPQIVQEKKYNETVKVWVAGCSSGEEAYSIAILFKEYSAALNKDTDVKIFATDLDKDAIDFASRGIYTENSVKEMDTVLRDKYFISEGGKYRVNPDLRKMVIFAHHDLLKDPPFSRMDLVTCRNLLIYLNNALQKKVLSSLHFALNLNGFLFLGPSESINDFKNQFIDINKKWKFYKNQESARGGNFDNMSFPIFKSYPRSEATRSSKSILQQNFLEMLNETLLTEFSFAGVFVDENFEIMHAIGDLRSFLRMPDKFLHLNLLKMLQGDWAVTISTAVRKSLKTNEKVVLRGLRSTVGENDKTYSCIVKPFVSDRLLQKISLVLFSFDEKSTYAEKIIHSGDDFVSERFQEIEQELKDTKENLQSAIEELETSNEELQSANEELLSANEELQSTNEELQSLNEELHTVNSEHQLKIKDLIELNDDLSNYFRSTEIGQIFLDRNLIIRKFTPSIATQINLIETDIGRPFSHLSTNLKNSDITKIINKSIVEATAFDTEVQVTDGRWFQMKIMPYIKQDKRIDGVVITFTDITRLKELNHLISAIFNNSLIGIIALEKVTDNKGNIVDFRTMLRNKASQDLLQSDLELGSFLKQTLPVFAKESLFNRLVNVYDTDSAYHFTLNVSSDDKNPIWIEGDVIRLEQGITITLSDISDKRTSQDRIEKAYEEVKIAEEKLRKLNADLEKRVQERTRQLSLSEERFKILSSATTDIVWDWEIGKNNVWWNDNFTRILGFKSNEVESGIDSLYQRIHIIDREKIIKAINSVINNGEKFWTGEYMVVTQDERILHILDRGYVLYDENNTPYRMIGSMVDLTEMKQMQEDLQKTNNNLTKINADLDNFIYTASHDLKAPISNIEGLVTALDEIIKPKTNEVENVLGMMNVSIKRFKSTIKDLTDITKLEKEMTEEDELVNIEELVEEVQLYLKKMIDDAGVKIKTNLPEKIIKFSKKNLRSVVYNVMSNGVKYRDPSKTATLHISSHKEDDYLVLTFADNGLGIDHDKQDKIFSMFKRLHDHVEGTGVGLYIVKRILENSGGKILVESEPKVGSKFKVYLKVKDKIN